MQVPVKQLKKESNPYTSEKLSISEADTRTGGAEAALEQPDKPVLEKITQGNLLGSEENRLKRREMIEAKGFEPTEFAYERAIGRNDSLYSNFIELLALTKRKVGRIVVIENGKKTGYGTGFLVSNDLLLTNWHVFRTEEMATDSEVQFFYEYNALGRPNQPAIFKLDTKKFYYSYKPLDYCFVGVQPADITGKVSLSSIGYLFLDKALGKIGDKGVERLNIIHHPLGDYKQVSIRENLFVDIDDTRIFYETDTAQGSSGSPVFNDQWQVVGLHHRSVAKMTPDEQHYLDKDDKIIPISDDGKIDASRIVWLKNEGMRISVVLNHLIAKFPGNSLVDGISVPPPAENLGFSIGEETNPDQTPNSHAMNNSKTIQINIPVDALSSERTIDISVSAGSRTSGSKPASITTERLKDTGSSLFDEVAKVEKEAAADFRNCRGYNPRFLGTEIALPQPKKAMEKHLAYLKNKKTELKYYKYSVIFNASRRMPLISAINVEGDPDKRKDNSKRNDDWLRDKRIDAEVQLNDKFYSGSNFDKGHMSRWEDANWDDTEADAKRNGIYTCFYTNACPQVVDLNRAGGLWGKLEKRVLEKGIKAEAGKQARMSVFNGPIFDDSKDRQFRSVTIPMQFFKIIAWLDDAGKLKATGFRLSQETKVGHIEFDEMMRMEEEAIDIDKVAEFRNYQVSIKKLGKLAGIDFSELEKYDTYKPGNNGEETLLLDEESMML